jgi:polyhydroxyalkanoate synthesis repressor PhaR
MPIIIKRYRNRKLYNTHSKKYITLEEIEGLIKQQVEVKIIDNTSGQDITATTLSQIIFELEKNNAGFLPINLLINLVQFGGNRLDELRRNIFTSLNLSHHYDVEIERRVNILIEYGEYSQEEGNKVLERLLKVGSTRDEVFENIESRIWDFFKQREIPTRNDYQSVLNKIDDLSKKVDEIYTDEVAGKRTINTN